MIGPDVNRDGAAVGNIPGDAVSEQNGLLED
jgi:hypothetical protein